MKDLGYLKGDNCNRNGCIGIIEEHYSENGCSCHINPPCSYCTTSMEYCPECGWDGSEEQGESEKENIENGYNGFGSKKIHDYYHEQQEKYDQFKRDFESMYSGKIKAEKLIIIYETHTHFTMIKRGVFPIGSETRESLREKIQGTFGGRFEEFNDFRFKYIAYTD